MLEGRDNKNSFIILYAQNNKIEKNQLTKDKKSDIIAKLSKQRSEKCWIKLRFGLWVQGLSFDV